MSIRRLLLPLTGTTAGEAALSTALIVARMWDAHLTALHVRIDSRDVAPLAGEGLSGAMIEEMMSATEKESSERSNAVRSLFDRFVAEHGVVVHEPTPGAGATANFYSITGREEDLVAQLARLADLTVVPHPEAGDEVSSSDALHAVLFDSGRPVLIAPQAHRPRLAAASALPGTERRKVPPRCTPRFPGCSGQRRSACCIRTSINGEDPARPRWQATSRCTTSIEVAQFRPQERDVGRGLLGAAREFGADLLCMGAYSHSRLRQLILGGVTRHVLEHAKLPVMMNR